MGWTNVPKPAESSIVVLGTLAEPFGLLVALTSIFSSSTSVTTGWTGITKPVSSVGAWTNTSKPTASVGAWTNISKPV